MNPYLVFSVGVRKQGGISALVRNVRNTIRDAALLLLGHDVDVTRSAEFYGVPA